MAALYQHFAKGWDGLDFTDEALLEMYNNESYGTPIINKKKNGYYVGKQWMGVAIAMWKEDRARGHLYLNELYECPIFPHWWLDSVFGVKYEYKSRN